MRSFILLLILCCSFSFANAQTQPAKEFEGYIEYTHKFKITGSAASMAQLKAAFGTSSVYYYKNGHYKWVFKGSRAQYELYDPARNEFYVYYADQPPVMVGADAPVKVLKDSVLASKVQLAGYSCSQYKITSVMPDKGNWTRIFSYNNRLSLNPAHFAKCGANDLKHIYKVTKALPLKIEVMGTGDYTMSYEAVKVVPKALDDAMFNFPE